MHIEIDSWKDEIKGFLKEIDVEQNQKNVKQLASILEVYLSQSPLHGKRFKSGAAHAALKDAFSEMKKKWYVAGQPDLLIEWTRNLKGIIKKKILSDSGNDFEIFNRQISKKYGPPAPREDDQYRYGGLVDDTTAEEAVLRSLGTESRIDQAERLMRRMDRNRSDLGTEYIRNPIYETEDEISTEYRRGYKWIPEKKFDGLGDVEEVHLSMTGSRAGNRVSIYFWLITHQKCSAKIDEKAEQAF